MNTSEEMELNGDGLVDFIPGYKIGNFWSFVAAF